MVTEENVKTTNRQISQFLEMVAQQESGPIRVTATHLSDLLSDIQEMNAALYQYSHGAKNVRGEHEIIEYRANLEKLNAAMPPLKARLLTERAHLEHERNHLKAAVRWAQTNHKTL